MIHGLRIRLGILEPPIEDGVAHDVGTSPETQFAHRVRLVDLDGLDRDLELCGDLLVALAHRHPAKHFLFAIGDDRRGRPPPGIVLRVDPSKRGIDVALARTRGANRGEQLARGTLLEDIAGSPGLEKFVEIGAVVVTGQRHDGRGRSLRAQPPRRDETVRARHREIQHDDRRLQLAGAGDGASPVRGFSHDGQVGLCVQEQPQPFADGLMILGEEHANHARAPLPPPAWIGALMKTDVPRPGVDSMSSVAPASAARSRMLASPMPRSGIPASDGSNPTPSSSTTRTIWPLVLDSSTSARGAWACLATVLSASCTMR